MVAAGGKVRRPEELWKIWSDSKINRPTRIVAEGEEWEKIKKLHNII